ncbi:MAG: Rab family GTPase [Promethearchaeota archaeon]
MLKVCVGGDGGVGKTTFLYRLCQNTFINNTKMTVGVSFLTKNMTLLDGPREFIYNLALWDFGGQDQFRFILKTYVLGAHGGLVFFALDRMPSFMNVDEWIELLRSEKPDLPIVLVGTKADLEDEDMLIPEDEIMQKVREHDLLGYIRTSSKTGDGIEDPINLLVNRYHETYMK